MFYRPEKIQNEEKIPIEATLPKSYLLTSNYLKKLEEANSLGSVTRTPSLDERNQIVENLMSESRNLMISEPAEISSKRQVDILLERKLSNTAKSISDKALVESNDNQMLSTPLDAPREIKVKKEELLPEEALMLEEDREVGVVSWKVYGSYLEYYGGYSIFFLIQLGN